MGVQTDRQVSRHTKQEMGDKQLRLNYNPVGVGDEVKEGCKYPTLFLLSQNPM